MTNLARFEMGAEYEKGPAWQGPLQSLGRARFSDYFGAAGIGDLATVLVEGGGRQVVMLATASRAAFALDGCICGSGEEETDGADRIVVAGNDVINAGGVAVGVNQCDRSEEHTSELQSRGHLVCR